MFNPKENRCRRFQANIFNRRKCQNCFRTLDSHTLSESDLNAIKPIKAGWLLLAPEGIDFLNPAHKNRKWQRRYFILYEHGLLQYALDEMPGTLPQGSVNMSQCSAVQDASSKTNFRNSLRLGFSDRDYYIRAENAENITGWRENLLVHSNAVKTSNKKRRLESLHNVKKHTLPDRNKVSESCSRSTTKKRSPELSTGSVYSMSINESVYCGDLNTLVGAEATNVNRCDGEDTSGSDLGGVEVGCPIPSSPEAGLPEEPEELNEKGGVCSSSRMSHASSPNTSFISSYLCSTLSHLPSHFSTNATKRREGIDSGYSSLEKTRADAEDAQTGPDQDYRRSQVISQFEQENEMHMPAIELCSSSSISSCYSAECDQDERTNHSRTRVFAHGESGVCASKCRRSKSLERSLAEHTNTPDLLNFKKGWMKRLGEDGKWRKHWFVLTNQALRFYRDSVAEEAADMDGEINLSTCYDITDFPMQKKYGFQIHTKDGVFTLCATTHGIRRNWIQAVMKNIQTSVAPDVTCSLPPKVPTDMVSECKFASASNPPCSEEEKRSSIVERRREGRYKTFDWAEFNHMRTKRETLSRQAEIDSEFVSEDSVPPAPAPSPEEPVASSVMVSHTATAQDSHFTKPADSSTLMVRSSIVAGKPADQKNAEVDGVDVFNDLSSNTQMEEKKEIYLYTMPAPATFSSLSVQTEWQWELELQTLHSELKAMYERSEREARDYKLSEAHLQTELSGSLDLLHETETKLQKTEGILRERESALEELQSSLDEVSGRLKATEEAQALKDARLQRHLRLLEESQERERRSLHDSLEHAEKRGKELEERLMQTEAMLQKMPTGGMVEQLERKCQELQNQLDESDSEMSRLQARLRNEETLYYDMEHNYEQVCEELEFVRGKLQNCEWVCEERFRIQLEQQQEKLNRKEQELQEILLKMGCSGVTVEMTGIFQPHAFNQHLQVGPCNGENVKNFGFVDLKMQPVAQGDESEQVISVIQALESKLCDTEERLREITLHLRQQQQKLGHEVNADKVDQWSVQIPNESVGPGARNDNPNGKHCGIIQETIATNTKVNLVTSKLLNFDLQEALQDKGMSPEKILSQGLTSRMLSLEALVIQRMASALEHPSKRLLEGLLELQFQTKALRGACDGRLEGPVMRNYSQLFSYYQEMGEAGCLLDECEIYSMCMKAELAYLTYTNHLHNTEEEHGSQAFKGPFCLGSGVTSLNAKEETISKTGLWLSDVSLPELVPCKPQSKNEKDGCCPVDMDKDSLVAELQAQACSLQALSKQLHPLDEDADRLSGISPVLFRTVLFQAILAYVACKLHVALRQKVRLLQEKQEQAACQCRRLEAMLQEQNESYEEKLREGRVVIEVAELARISAETDTQIKGQEVQQLEAEFNKKLQDLQQFHELEMRHLHGYYTENQSPTVTLTESINGEAIVSVTAMKERIRELELQVRCLEEELRRGDGNTLRKAYEQELETLKVTCELGFSSIEQSHQRVIEEMQRQHLIEVEQLLEEKERVLQEETNATLAAIEAMRKAHKEELEKYQKVQQRGAGTDFIKLRAQFKDELDSLHRELEVLSEQYSQKCLENANLNRALETERQALSSVERENQKLHKRNQELNEHLVVELSQMQSCVNGGIVQMELSQGKDVIQLEVALRVKESELQCLKQEISSLKEELQAANRHCKKLLNELSISGARCPALFKCSAETCRQRSQSYDVMKSRSNPDFLKNQTKPNQPTRSKSLIEHLSVQERMKLFETGSK
ncbi:myosin phosphatase Rho-interacting protein isoform X2 [Tachysurus fulvidraco]|uniref:myosin phosphatase Rho-interacting protein isoform X2 n=1 Tax=Tachysurus fulvidraco TaxID=1234273 RepID=UPI000F506E88|nr:myosin phosphatase Rho-interacting protein isoform X2 [Tachysurus fulvidraco]